MAKVFRACLLYIIIARTLDRAAKYRELWVGSGGEYNSPGNPYVHVIRGSSTTRGLKGLSSDKRYIHAMVHRRGEANMLAVDAVSMYIFGNRFWYVGYVFWATNSFIWT